MNELLIVSYGVSAVTAILLYKKIGFWWAILIAFCAPFCLFLIATVLLLAGGDH